MSGRASALEAATTPTSAAGPSSRSSSGASSAPSTTTPTGDAGPGVGADGGDVGARGDERDRGVRQLVARARPREAADLHAGPGALRNERVAHGERELARAERVHEDVQQQALVTPP